MDNYKSIAERLKEGEQQTLPDWRWFIPAVIGIALVIAAVCYSFASADIVWESFSNEQIVEAIGKAENSRKYPYGIKSIDTKGNKEYARKICLNSVRNNRKRWIKANKPCDFITFIGSRFCPTTIKSEYNLNKNWVKNVKHFLLRGEI
jgi:hypothetical protein